MTHSGHQEGRHAQRQDQGQGLAVGDQVCLADAQDAPLAGEEHQHPHRADGLAEDGGDGCALHPHVQPIDEDGVQDDVADRADAGGGHAGARKALVGDEGGHAQSELDKDGAQQVDAQVGHGVGQGVFAGAEGPQHRLAKDGEHHAQRHRQDDQQGDAVAQDLFRRLVVAAAHGHRGPGRAAHADQVGKSGDQHDDGVGDPQAGQRQAAGAGDVPHVDAVHDVVQHIDQLCQRCGQSQAEDQRHQRGRSQPLVHRANGAFVFFHGGNSFFLPMNCIIRHPDLCPAPPGSGRSPKPRCGSRRPGSCPRPASRPENSRSASRRSAPGPGNGSSTSCT